MYYDQVNDIHLVSKMGQIIKVQRPVSSAHISGLYPRLEYYSEHRKMRAKQQHVCKEMNQYISCIYDQYQPEMDSKFLRMDNRSEVQEIPFNLNKK